MAKDRTSQTFSQQNGTVSKERNSVPSLTVQDETKDGKYIDSIGLVVGVCLC